MYGATTKPSTQPLMLLCVDAALAAALLIINKTLLPAWYLVLISLAAFTFSCGRVVTGRRLGALIDERNVMSLEFKWISTTML